MEVFHNFQHLLTYIFSSSDSPEAVVESNQSTNESLDRESPQAHISTQQQDIEIPSNTGAVGGSITSDGNGQDSEVPRRRLSSQQQIARSFRVSKTPSPPLRRSPRNIDHKSSSSKEVVDSSQRPTDEGPGRESPRDKYFTKGQQQIVKCSRVSKPPSPPLRRSPRATDPRSARHGSIPSQCCEYVDEATQQRCGNFQGFQQIEVNPCETEGSSRHREFGDSYNVCEPCRTRVSQDLLIPISEVGAIPTTQVAACAKKKKTAAGTSPPPFSLPLPHLLTDQYHLSTSHSATPSSPPPSPPGAP